MSAESLPRVEVTFERMAYGGDALGRLPDGKAVFVPLVLPGETALIEVVEERKNFARGRLVTLITKSAQRLEARCRHFGDCGGCHYQHLAYEDQLALKGDLVRDQLRRVGGFTDPPVRAALPSPQAWYYRNGVQFHLNADGRLGFQRMQSNQVIPIIECHLPMEAIQEIWPQLEMDAPLGEERIHLRCNAEGDALIGLETVAGANAPELLLEAPLSVVHFSPAGSSVLAGEDGLILRVLERDFRVSAASFFQVNLPQAETMLRHVMDLAPQSGGTLVDLYCGVGLFTAFLAERYDTVIAVESSESACQDFAENLDDFDHVSLYMGAAEQVLPALELGGVDTLLVDPPRAGLDRRAMDAVVRMRPRQIISVSCDPASFARDAKLLCQSGYRLVTVIPVDMFPQTYHIETISLFERLD